MTTLFVGWDVGAWNCDDKSRSQDALCILTGSSLDELVVAAEPWRGNLREALVEHSCPGAVLRPCHRAERHDDVVIAIDTPLGWPQAFVSLLEARAAPVLPVPKSAAENPYVFRTTERALVQRNLFAKGRTPLSAVRDMIGSQSSKGIYFLRKGNMIQDSVAVWTTDGCTAIETYPTPVRSSHVLRPHFERLVHDRSFEELAATGKALEDHQDSLWCALVAALHRLAPEALAGPPADDVLKHEGWIWIPKDCRGPIDRDRGAT